jgi:superoxide dismutase
MITLKIKVHGMHLSILEVDFNNKKYRIKYINKRENKPMLKRIWDNVDGTFVMLVEVVNKLKMVRINKV